MNANELIEKMKDSRDSKINPDFKIGLNTLNEWIEDLSTLKSEGVNNKTLQNLMNEISAWSDSTFGKGQRNPAIAHHLLKEVTELITSLNEFQTNNTIKNKYTDELISNTYYEFADCFMLLLDSANHFGMTADNLCYYTKSKLEINKKREWKKPDKNGVVEHIKDLEERKDNTCEVCKKDKYLTSTTPDKGLCVCQSHPPQSEVSEVRIKPEEFLKDMGYSEIIKTPEGIIEPSFQWLTVINLLKEYDSRKWMQDKLYRSKKECWGCYKKLPKGHKSGLCSDCQIRG